MSLQLATAGRPLFSIAIPRALIAQRAIYLPLYRPPRKQVNQLFAPRYGDKPSADEESDAGVERVEAGTEGLAGMAGWKDRDMRLFLRLFAASLEASRQPFPSVLDRANAAYAMLSDSIASAFPRHHHVWRPPLDRRPVRE